MPFNKLPQSLLPLHATLHNIPMTYVNDKDRCQTAVVDHPDKSRTLSTSQSINKSRTSTSQSIKLFFLVVLFLTTTTSAVETASIIAAAEQNDLTTFMSIMRSTSISIDVQNDNGATALQWAAHHGNLEMVDTLITSGANVNLANEVGYTPLIHACMGEHEGVALYLIRAKADVNAITKDAQSTALMFASWKGMLEVVKELVGNGANMMATDSHGHRAISVAKNREVREYLARRSGEDL